MTGFLVLLVILICLAYRRATLPIASLTLLATALLFATSDFSGPVTTLLAFALTAVTAVLAYQPMRRALVSDPALAWFRKVLPSLSQTEQEALDAGTVWWDAELFSGNPDWQRLLATPEPRLSEAEQAFLDGPVEELCHMLDDWQIQQDGDLPQEVWQFLKEHRFFSMIIAKEYGGLDFSPAANSAVVMKLSTCNLTAAITVMVPNSLGPGELLSEFGTQQQRDHYLPRLARGEDIPCFALTSATAGSDAAAMPDTGIVCKGEWEGSEVLGLRVTWDKRYITLAPVATVLGLAFHAYDPDHLLGEEEDLGITCALIPTATPGVWTGNRHMPIGSVFMNGPTRGKDVFIPFDYIIGGQQRIGEGWRMLMHSLAAGRAISLPAQGVAGGKFAARTSGEYARIRKQFGMPIAYLEGIEEPLARIAGTAYRMDAARLMTLSALSIGEKPGVLKRLEECVLPVGAADATAPKVRVALHFFGDLLVAHDIAYQTIPIAITVEGANILTRSLIIFGQGAIRNHPYLLKEMAAAAAEETEDSRNAFDDALFSHVGFSLSNLARAFVLGLSGARLVKSPVNSRTAHYYRQLTRLSAAFAFVSDMVLLALGGSFKFREKISGRLADVLSHLYLASAVLKRFEDTGRPKEDHPLVHWAMRDSLYQIQLALINTLRNFPIRWLGQVIKLIIFPLGTPYKEPSDTLGKHTARILITDNPARDRLTEGMYLAQGDDIKAKLSRAFQAVLESSAVERKLKKGLNENVTYENYRDLSETAIEQGLIDASEAELLATAMELTREVINVDDFPPQEVAEEVRAAATN